MSSTGESFRELNQPENLKYSEEFSFVYAAVLENWLETKSQPILGEKFTPLRIV